ncbi:18468_t:CDS:2 [Dentiscutata erythropus]|uniref:18468_t:CDS:1 n=1 Tax=Dentiscutata erythropus TaxID=1348616 RepID=A0A9N9P2W1_9GLOM|nr:18468_t:CDS:2 [Dentiscutata erythropus]
MWDIENLSIYTHILIDWNYMLEYIEISDDEELLLNLFIIDSFHLIASRKGERLLYISNGQYKLVDPYNLENPIDAKLKDTNSIPIPSRKIVDIITNITNTITDNNYSNDNRKVFEGKILKWGLELEDKSVRLTVIDFNYDENDWNPDDKKKQLDILPSFYTDDGKNFILHCEVLENDDLITITRIGVIIWTYKTICENLDVRFGEKKLFEELLKNDIDDEFYLACYGEELMRAFISLNYGKWIRYLGQRCLDKCVQNDNYLISKISLLSIIFEWFNVLSKYHPAFIANILSRIRFVVPSTMVIPDSSHLSSYGIYYHLSKTSSLDILISKFWNRWDRWRFQNWIRNFFSILPEFILVPLLLLCSIPAAFFIELYKFFHAKQYSIILAVPYPNFVSYPKYYNILHESIIPSNSPFSLSNKYIQDDKWSKPYFSQNLREVLQLDDEEQLPKESIKDLKT